MRQIAVIGLGRFGSVIARTLSNKGVEVIAIDSNREHVDELKDYVALAVSIDATDENALRAIGIENIDAAVVAIGDNIEANLLTTSLLKRIGVKNIYVRAKDRLQVEILRYMEVDKIINLEEEMAIMVANSMVASNIEKHVPLASGHSLMEIKVPQSFVGKSLGELQLRNRFHVNIIAIKRQKVDIDEKGNKIVKEVVNNMPKADDTLDGSDILIVVGTDKDINAIMRQ